MGKLTTAAADYATVKLESSFSAVGVSALKSFGGGGGEQRRGFNISLWGLVTANIAQPIVGTVRLVRSFDGGTTILPVTYADGTAVEWANQVVSSYWDEHEPGVLYGLECTAYSAAINYRLSQ